MFNHLRRCCRDMLILVAGWVPMFFQIIYGLWKMARLPKPRITFFGGARFGQDHKYAQIAKELASELAGHNISVITGGGPGIMEAANCGVDLRSKNGRAQTMGIMVTDLGDEKGNPCSHLQITLRYFFARKWLLTRYSSGFVVFPGGFGTLDELMEVLTLIKTKKLGKVPVILFGKDYWQPMIDWLETKLLPDEMVYKDEIKLMFVTDSKIEVVKKLCDYCIKN